MSQPEVKLAIPARPTTVNFDLKQTALVIIDMQRDFLELGGFGASLGNDVSLLRNIIPGLRLLLEAWRWAGGTVIHTREAHLADLSDCPPLKLSKGSPDQRIGDKGPLGRLLVRGEAGHAIIPELAPVPGELVIDKPGKGAFYATDLEAELKKRGILNCLFTGVTAEVCVQTSLREANDRGIDCLLLEDATASYLPPFKQAVIDMVASQGGLIGSVSRIYEVLHSLFDALAPRLTWSQLRPGVQIASLGSGGGGWPGELALLRYEAGASVPLHEHVGEESLLMLSGSQSDARGTYPAGTCVVNRVGTSHALKSAEGCTLLIHWDAPVRFL